VTLVIDASLTMTWYFDDETTAATDALLDRIADTGATVPALWRLEVANAFQVAIRRKRIDAIYRDESLYELALMPIVVDPAMGIHAWTTTLRLAEGFGLTIYDAVYLELAQRRDLPLATLDKALSAAASVLGISLVAI